MIRTLIHFLERKLGRKVNPQSPAMTWVIEHVGQIITRMKIGADGKVPYERVKGKKPSTIMLPILERVMYKPSDTTKVEREMQSRLWLRIRNIPRSESRKQ